MKKRIIIIAVVAALLVAGGVLFAVLSGKGEGDGKVEGHTYAVDGTKDPEDAKKEPLVLDGDTYKITEENYINGVNEIYANPDKYIGKRIVFEGEYMAEMYENEMYYQVYRTLKQHCDEEHDHTHDSTTRVGFRIAYDGNKPTDKTFVRVSGIVDTYEYNGTKYLIINADELTKCEETGIVELSQ